VSPTRRGAAGERAAVNLHGGKDDERGAARLSTLASAKSSEPIAKMTPTVLAQTKKVVVLTGKTTKIR